MKRRKKKASDKGLARLTEAARRKLLEAGRRLDRQTECLVTRGILNNVLPPRP